jgi:hypothetical protein
MRTLNLAILAGFFVLKQQNSKTARNRTPIYIFL